MTKNSKSITPTGRVFFWALAAVALVMTVASASALAAVASKSVVLLIGGLALFLVALAALQLQPENQLGLMVSIITTIPLVLFGDYALGTVVHLAASAQARKVEAKLTSLGTYDGRTQLEVVRSERAEGGRVVPALYASQILGDHVDDLLPLAGVSSSETLLCNEQGPYIRYQSDEHGFNNPADWPDQVDVMIVGDSFAHGMCVPPDDSVAGQLRKKGLSAISVGTSGSGPLLQLATMVEYIERLKPRWVVWMFYEGNDPRDLHNELKHPILRRYLADPSFRQDLVSRQGDIDAFWRDHVEQRIAVSSETRPGGRESSEVLRQAMTLYNVRQLLGLSGPGAVEVDAYGRILQRATTLALQHDAHLALVRLPGYQRLNGAPPPADFIDAMSSSGLPVLDFAQYIDQLDDPRTAFPFGLWGHYTAETYGALAQQISNVTRLPSATATFGPPAR